MSFFVHSREILTIFLNSGRQGFPPVFGTLVQQAG